MKSWHKNTLVLLLALAGLYVFRGDFPAKSAPAHQPAVPPQRSAALPQPGSSETPPVAADNVNPVEDYEPPLSQKTLDIIARAIQEKWPNVQIRALIAMTRDPGLIAELRGREPLDVRDWSTLMSYSPTREERWAAAESWAKADPQNAEPRYLLFVKHFQENNRDLKSLLPELKEIVTLTKCDAYFKDLSVAYDAVQKKYGLENELGLSWIQGGSTTQSPGRNALNLMAESLKTSEMSVDEKIEAAGLAAGLSRQILTINALSSKEYSEAISGELCCLLPLDGRTEYGEAGTTVADRINELQRLFDEQRGMVALCQDAFRENKNLGFIFKQRTQAVGEYEAYRQMYNLIEQSSPASPDQEAADSN